MPFHNWLLFAGAYLLTTLSPGPNVLLMLRNTLRHGTRGTLISIGGNLIVQCAVVILVAVGVGAVLTALPPLFILMKTVGAAYLIYLGVKQVRGAGAVPPAARVADAAESTSAMRATVAVQAAARADAPPAARGNGRLFREALLVSASNPKTVIFLSAFMPQFLAQGYRLSTQFVLMYLTIAAIVTLVHIVYAATAYRVQRTVARGTANGTPHWSERWARTAQRLCGGLFIGLGVKLLFVKRAT